MSQLKPPDTRAFLTAGSEPMNMAGVGRRGFGGEQVSSMAIHNGYQLNGCRVMIGSSPVTPAAQSPYAQSSFSSTPPGPVMASSPNQYGDDVRNQDGPYYLATMGHSSPRSHHQRPSFEQGQSGNVPMNRRSPSPHQHQYHHQGSGGPGEHYRGGLSVPTGVPIRREEGPRSQSGGLTATPTPPASDSIAASRQPSSHQERHAQPSDRRGGSGMTHHHQVNGNSLDEVEARPSTEALTRISPSPPRAVPQQIGMGSRMEPSQNRSDPPPRRPSRAGDPVLPPAQQASRGVQLRDEKPVAKQSVILETQPRSLRVMNASPDEEAFDLARAHSPTQPRSETLPPPATRPHPTLAIPPHATARSGSSLSVRNEDNVNPVSPSGSSIKLPFLEKYRQMGRGDSLDQANPQARAELNEANGRHDQYTTSNTSHSSTRESRLLNEPHFVDSPVRSQFGDDTRDSPSSLPWATVPHQMEIQTGVSHTFSDGSLSSIGSAPDVRAKFGELNILTPSGSMNQLDEIAAAEKRRDEQEQDDLEKILDDFQAEVENRHRHPLLSPPPAGAVTSINDATRDSYRSSLLGPSDSASTPAFDLLSKPEKIDMLRPVPGKKLCQKCGADLKGKRYVERDGIVLCEADWKQMFLPKVSQVPCPRHPS